MKAAVAPIGSVLFDTVAALFRVERFCRTTAAEGTRLVVFPEALLGCSPKALTFGATVGHHTPEGRDLFLRYSKAAITCPGAETELSASWAQELPLHIVIGVVEQCGATLYCSGLVFSPEGGLIGKHRKLMPTGTKRLLWEQGDGPLQMADTELGRIGVAICWENYMDKATSFL